MSARELRAFGYETEGTAALAQQGVLQPDHQRDAREYEAQREAQRRAALVRIYARRAAVLFLLTCLMMAGILSLQTHIQRNNIELNRLKNELANVQNENQALKIDIGYADDLNAARAYAQSQPGMNAAQPWQVIVVDLEAAQAQ